MIAFIAEIAREGVILELTDAVHATPEPSELVGRDWSVLFQRSPPLERLLRGDDEYAGPVQADVLTGGERRSGKVVLLWKEPRRNSRVIAALLPEGGPESLPDRMAKVFNSWVRERADLEQRLETFWVAIEHYPASVIIYDGERRFLYLNATGRERAGYPLEALKGRRDEDVFPPQVTEKYVPALERALHTRNSVGTEAVFAGGRERLAITYVPVLDESGHLKQILCVSRDVTTERKLERELQYQNRELQAMHRISEIALVHRNLVEAFEQILDEIRNFLGFSIASVQSYREESKKMVVEAARGIPGWERPLVTSREGSLCGDYVPFGKPFVAENVQLTEAWHQRVQLDETLRACLCVPITSEDHVIGALCLAHTEPLVIDERMQQWAHSIANYLGIIIARKNTEDALHESELRLERTEAFSLMMVAEVGLDGYWKKVPPPLADLLGYSRDELLKKPFLDCVHPDDRETCIDRERRLLEGEARSLEAEVRMLPKDLRTLWLYVNASVVSDDAGEPLYFLTFLRDITDKKQTEETLRLTSRVFDSSAEGIMITDARLKIVSVNRAFTTITGYLPGEVLGKTPRLLRSGRHDLEFYRHMWQSVSETGQWQGEIWNRRKDGTIFPELMTISAVTDERGKLTHYVGMFRDISAIKRYQSLLEQRANYDVLTGLPNRQLFYDRLNHSIDKAQRNSHRLAVLFVDLDNFKAVNDSLGHHVGDQLLREVAARLTHCTRREDTVARLGGDEFMVLLEEIENTEDIADSARRINETLFTPFQVDVEHTLEISGSVGISVFPDDGRHTDVLVKNADIAMYQAKQAGRNRYRFFTHEMNARAARHQSLEAELGQAVAADQLFLEYQPRFDVRTGRTTGLEAVLRWRHPRLGVRKAGEFITLAEESGLIEPIGRWVIWTASEQLREWGQSGKRPLPVAINLSTRELLRGSAVSLLRELASEYARELPLLELELNESTLMENSKTVIDRLRELHDLGVKLSIDDYGAGCSSLSQLKRLPIARLKIDQSIVHGLGSIEDSRVSDAIISVAHSIDAKVVAEGVETSEQFEFMRSHGCDEVQGNFCARPTVAAELTLY